MWAQLIKLRARLDTDAQVRGIVEHLEMRWRNQSTRLRRLPAIGRRLVRRPSNSH